MNVTVAAFLHKMKYVLSLVAVVAICLDLVESGPVIILPPETEIENEPICSSYDGLCGLDYRYVTEDGLPVQLIHSESAICRCPGNETCAIDYDWDNMTNSFIQKLLTREGHQLLVKISYCRLAQKPERPCGFTKPVLVSRGRGLFKFDVVGDMICNCDRPLVERSAWVENAYEYVEYGCGQPKCAKKNMTICSELVLSDDSLRSQYFCRCRRNERCFGDLPVHSGQTVQHTCQPREYTQK